MLIELLDKYGPTDSLVIRGDKIAEWPYNIPQPNNEEIKRIVAAYKAKTAYKEARIRAYPPLAEQLDMQYHDALDGTSKWVTTIASVKALYPKPE